MDVREPQVRRRGFFLHSSDAETHETGEQDSSEGVTVRVRLPRSTAHRQFASSDEGRQVRAEARTDDERPQIRSGSVTGSRQRAHLPR
jgi:hypothetical protein